MRYFTADYIFPVSSEPIKDSVLIVDDFGEVKEISPLSKVKNPKGEIEYYKGILCPGFVNAHCHLELSYLKNKLKAKTGLTGFITQVLKNRFSYSKEEIDEAIIIAEQEMIKNGIVAVGDISNTENTFDFKAEKKLTYHTFVEVLEISPLKAEDAMVNARRIKRGAKDLKLAASIVPHAAYTVSEKLLKLINEDAEKNKGIISIHNQESETESELFIFGTGEMYETFKAMGVHMDFMRVTEKNSLQSTMRFLKGARKILLVHNTYTSAKDIKWLKSEIRDKNCELYFCTCPNANMFIENKLPDYNLFMEEQLDVTIGTDSLASNYTLSILDELKTIIKHYPEIPLQTLLTWATKNGADFFDFELLGSFDAGKTPGINLLKNVDGMKITPGTEVERLL